jgi:curved DNA-binding protein CbpA
MSTNHYATLKVPITSSPHEIRAAYRAAARVAHPDRGGTAEAMAAVNVAYATLSSREKKRVYDRANGFDTLQRCTECAGKGTVSVRKGWGVKVTSCKACRNE